MAKKKRKKTPPPTGSTNPDRPLTLEQLAEAIGCADNTIRAWAAHGCPREPRQFVGGRCYYSLEEVQAWADRSGKTAGRRGRPSKLRVTAGKARAMGASRAPVRSPEAVSTDLDPGDLGPPSAADDLDLLIRKEAMSKARKAHWDSMMARLKTMRQEGDLVSREQVIAEHAGMVSRARDRLLALPGVVSAELAAASDARTIAAILEERIRLVLGDLSEGR